MHDVWQDIQTWKKLDTPVALATVVDVSGSSLRPEGSKMAISKTGLISGSVSGGCVEGAVFEEAQAVLESGVPRLLSYGVSNEQAWEVGLSCGGAIRVFVESMETYIWKSLLPVIDNCLERKESAVLMTVLAGQDAGSKLMLLPDGTRLGNLPERLGKQLPESSKVYDPTSIVVPTDEGDVSIFFDYIAPPARLIIIGAVHMAIPLVSLAKTLNFHTIVVDARSAFATKERFPHADELIVEWPSDALEKLDLDSSTCLVCLSHDDKLDNPALQVALKSRAFYIGALGSRVTHAKRAESLREEGVTDGELVRIHAPVGLQIGARQPDEIALAIMAEIIAARHGIGGGIRSVR